MIDSDKLSDLIIALIEKEMTGYDSEQARLETIVEALRWVSEEYRDKLSEQ